MASCHLPVGSLFKAVTAQQIRPWPWETRGACMREPKFIFSASTVAEPHKRPYAILVFIWCVALLSHTAFWMFSIWFIDVLQKNIKKRTDMYYWHACRHFVSVYVCIYVCIYIYIYIYIYTHTYIHIHIYIHTRIRQLAIQPNKCTTPVYKHASNQQVVSVTCVSNPVTDTILIASDSHC